MLNTDLIHVQNEKDWIKALRLCGAFDTYHLPGYHLLAQELGEGEPYLFFYGKGNQYAALPVLLRPISQIEGLEDCPYFDATSVYGYPGIVTSVNSDDLSAREFRAGFQSALISLFKDLKVLAFFTRTNPILVTSWMFEHMAEVSALTATVAIDLTASEEDQFKEMTKGHRYDIRRAHREGVVAEEDPDFRRIGEFVDIYNDTMRRVGSSNYYYFPDHYYTRLKSLLGESVKLFFARLGDTIVSAALFLVTGSIIQYHLSGTPAEEFSRNGTKVILDKVRAWGSQTGLSWLHLGGGVGSRQDSLFRFKAGFSRRRFTFEVVKLIIEPRAYSIIVETRREWLLLNSHPISSSGYFPKYRQP